MRIRRIENQNFWPSYVDALATLLMVIIFILMLFVVIETYLDEALSTKTQDVHSLQVQLQKMNRLLADEQQQSQSLQTHLKGLIEETQGLSQHSQLLEKELETLQAQKGAVEQSASNFQNDLLKAQQLIEEFKKIVTTAYGALAVDIPPQDIEIINQKDLPPLEREQKMLELLSQLINKKLAQKMEELEDYRSEFFGKIKESLGNHPEVHIVGDRFVLQSEVLFDSASAQLGIQGKKQLTKIAGLLKEISKKIPSHLPWILRVDGHTDPLPIHRPEFRSNWELSVARAIAVVDFMIQQGINPRHLAATGFGEFQPLEASTKKQSPEQVKRRNRRIELKLDQR